MSKREPRLSIEDILDCSIKIISYTKDLSYEEYIKTAKLLMQLSEISK